MGSSDSKISKPPPPVKASAVRGTYQYNPLQKTSYFRLLKLLPGQAGEKIQVEIDQHDFHGKTEYLALSYSWGDTTLPGKTIYVRNKSTWTTLEVTVNLFDALNSIRKKDGSFTIWIDALCINQKDDVEKSYQLRLMPTLYPKARKVLAWVGKEDPTTALAIECIMAWYKESSKSIEPDKPGKRALREKMLDDLRKGNKDTSKALHNFFGRDWFTRMWIVQEVCVNPDNAPLIICGHHQLPFEFLVFAFWAMATTLTTAESEEVFGKSFLNIMPLMKLFGADRRTYSMSRVLPAVAARKATYPADKIYGILGLVTRHGHGYPDPDYKLEPWQICIRYTRAIIGVEKDLNILLNVSPNSSDSKIPSWAIKHDHLGDSTTVATDTDRGAHRFKATLQHHPQVKTSQEFDHALHLKGAKLDRVKALLNTADIFKQIESCETWSALTSFISRLSTGLKLGDRYSFTNEPTSKAFLRTICIDNFIVGTPSSTYADDFAFQKFASTYVSRNHSSSGGAQPSPASNQHLRTHLNKHYDLGKNPTVAAGSGEEPLDRSLTRAFVDAADALTAGRKLFVTQHGRIGLAPRVQVRDEICLFHGAACPVVVRQQPQRKQGEFALVGAAYVHGMMYGEACGAMVAKEEFITLV